MKKLKTQDTDSLREAGHDIERMKRNSTHPKVLSAKKNAELFIAEMQKMSDKRLSKKLDLYTQQMQMAFAQKKYDAYELLWEYERQIIEARVGKK